MYRLEEKAAILLKCVVNINLFYFIFLDFF